MRLLVISVLVIFSFPFFTGCSKGDIASQTNTKQNDNSINDVKLCANNDKILNDLDSKIIKLADEIKLFDNNKKQETSISSSLSKQILELSAKIDQLISSQNLGRADERILSILTTFQQKLQDLSKGDLQSKKVTELSEEFNKFTINLTNQDREIYLEDIALIDWSMRALTTIIQYQDQKPKIKDLIELTSLAAISPAKSPEWIINSINQLSDSKKTEWLDWNTNPNNKNSISSAEIEMAIVKLDISELNRNKLVVALLNQQISRVELLDDTRIKKGLAENTHDSALKLRYSLAGIEDKKTVEPTIKIVENILLKSESILSEIESIKLKEESKRIRQYQGWALKQIDTFLLDSYPKVLADIKSKFEAFKDAKTAIEWRLLTEYPGFTNEIEKLIGSKLSNKGRLYPNEQRDIYAKVSKIIGWKNDAILAQLVTREAMVKYLLPIDDRFLMPAVGKYFAKQYDEAITSLEGTDSYTYVLKKTVDVEKVMPSDI